MMRIPALLIFSVFIGLTLHAQPIECRIHLYAGYTFGGFHGKSLVNEDNFIVPALYPNFQGMRGWTIKGLWGGNGFYRFGAGVDHLKTFHWEYQKNSDYEDSEVVWNSVAVTSQFYTRLSLSGSLSRVSVFVEVSPVVGSAKLTLNHPLFEIQSEGDPVEQPMESTDLFTGGRGSAGFEFLISNTLGFYMAYSFSYQWVNSDLYHDNHMISSQVSAGFFAKLMKDKRYFY